MISGKKVLGIITARGGSKGIPDKNIYPLGGKPLIAWTIEAAKQSKYLDKLILSSDSEKIIKVALEFGCEVPFVRPSELSIDTTPGIDPVLHALDAIEEEFDYVVLLQPTSPLRNSDDIDGCIEKAVNSTGFCVSVTKPSKSPYWMFTLGDSDKLMPLLKSEATRRQDLPLAYALNGAAYVAQVEKLKEENAFLTPSTTAFIMPKERSIDVDDKIDIMLCQLLLEQEK